MGRVIVLAVSSASAAARVRVLAGGWRVVEIDPRTPPGELVAEISAACGGWPEQVVAVADGPMGGNVVVGALTGALPVQGVAVAAEFDSLPLRVRGGPPVVIVGDPDAEVLADRFANVQLAEDLAQAVSLLLSRLP